MMQDDFINRIITPKGEDTTMNREFYGMMAVAHSEQKNADEDEWSDSS